MRLGFDVCTLPYSEGLFVIMAAPDPAPVPRAVGAAAHPPCSASLACRPHGVGPRARPMGPTLQAPSLPCAAGHTHTQTRTNMPHARTHTPSHTQEKEALPEYNPPPASASSGARVLPPTFDASEGKRDAQGRLVFKVCGACPRGRCLQL